MGWLEQAREEGAGPAQEFSHADYRGQIGIIAPYSKDFCNTCNRLRVTAIGDLRLCLFGNGGHSLRYLLQHRNQRDELQATIAGLLRYSTNPSVAFPPDGYYASSCGARRITMNPRFPYD